MENNITEQALTSIEEHFLTLSPSKLTINSFGKFEQQAWYAPYYYDVSMDNQDAMFIYPENKSIYFVKTTLEERIAFNLGMICEYAVVTETNDGFIYLTFADKTRLQEAQDEYESYPEHLLDV